MKCGTKECPHYSEKFIDHCHLGSECQDYTSWKSNRIKELETAMQDTLDWYLEYGVILKPQIERIKQLLQK